MVVALAEHSFQKPTQSKEAKCNCCCVVSLGKLQIAFTLSPWIKQHGGSISRTLFSKSKEAKCNCSCVVGLGKLLIAFTLSTNG